MQTALIRTSAIVLAFVCGWFLPSFHHWSGLIMWLMVAMLYITFLGVKITKLKPTSKHWILISVNIAIGLGSYFILHAMGYETLAIAAFFVGITPTATAAPIIIGFLRGSVEFVLTSLILCNAVICALLPLIMPSIVGAGSIDIYGDIAKSVGFVMLIPAISAILTRRIYPKSFLWSAKLRNISFGLWVISLFLIASHASYDIHTQTEFSSSFIWKIASISLALCIFNFTLGYIIGGKMKRECSQSLGQKNTTLTIFLAMMYAPSPIFSLGPTFYVLWHNLWNAWQLHRHSSRKDT